MWIAKQLLLRLYIYLTEEIRLVSLSTQQTVALVAQCLHV